MVWHVLALWFGQFVWFGCKQGNVVATCHILVMVRPWAFLGSSGGRQTQGVFGGSTSFSGPRGADDITYFDLLVWLSMVIGCVWLSCFGAWGFDLFFIVCLGMTVRQWSRAVEKKMKGEEGEEEEEGDSKRRRLE